MTKNEAWLRHDGLPLLIRLPIMFVGYCLIVLVFSIPLAFMLMTRPFTR